MPPSAVVFGRTLLGAAFLVPLAITNRAFCGLCRCILPVVVVTLLDIALPTFLTTWGEERVSSSVAGILAAGLSAATSRCPGWISAAVSSAVSKIAH